MLIAIDDVKKAADLAKIRVEEERCNILVEELNALFGFIQQIEEVDTTNVEPLISVTDHQIFMREDVVNDGAKSHDILENAPLAEQQFFLVPKVVE